ncbi:ATP-binding protein [Weissella confusa]|uniref:ATP-binding protein n=1 Tax=Weissella confusa TaxID=1583 RepID=UPI001082000A|nr:ATP-binding protein [Weissella confusa]MED4273908.1 ATP-binding protein [Weissella confusa]TGE70341.1 hypothetical protein C6P15_04785 [Weissella confusa]
MVVEISIPGEPTVENAKKQIRELKRSYHNPYDVMTELIQNAVDAVNRKRRESENSGIVFEPRVSITISQKDKTIKIADNGDGMTSEELSNSVQMYNSGKENETESVGEKGVGLSFAIFSTDDIHIRSVHNGLASVAQITGSNTWLMNANVQDKYKISVTESETSKENGTEVTINKLADEYIFNLSKEQFEYYLRTQTAIGNFENEYAGTEVHSVKVMLYFTDLVGETTEKEVPYRLFLLDDISKNLILDFNKYQKDAATLDDGQKRNRLSGKYLRFKGEVEKAGRLIRWVGYFTPSAEEWENRNHNMGYDPEDGDPQFPAMKFGSYLSVKNMPTGISFDADTKGDSGYFNRLYIILNDDTLTFDLGRKSVEDQRKVRSHKQIVQDEFSKYRRYVAKYVKKASATDDEGEDESIGATIGRLKATEEKFIAGEDTCFYGVPEQEGTIAGMFFEQVGKGRFGDDFKILQHGYSAVYDVYAEVGYTPVAMDFKQRISSLFRDIYEAVKDANELNYVVMWELNAEDRKQIADPKNAVVYEENEILDEKHLFASGFLNFSNVKNRVYVVEMKKILSRNV